MKIQIPMMIQDPKLSKLEGHYAAEKTETTITERRHSRDLMKKAQRKPKRA